MRTNLPDWDRARLELTARGQGELVAAERGADGPLTNDTDRLVVNMCRHEFTTCDDDQSERAHRAACLAIKAKYPWLAPEGEAQMRRRALLDAEATDMHAVWEAEQAAPKAAPKQRSAESARVIDGLAVGMVVGARIKGHEQCDDHQARPPAGGGVL